MTRSRMMIARTILLFALLGGLTDATAQEKPVPSVAASPASKSVRISFLPPPLEGTISLGIYDRKGKLVRVLHREADIDEFEVGDDALNTKWDGRDDNGEPLPAGEYGARGFVVGAVGVEGIGFYFNDWVTGDRSERIERICGITADGDGVAATATLATGKSEMIVCNSNGDVTGTREGAGPGDDCAATQSAEPGAPVPGRNGTRWAIEPAAPGSEQLEVRQYSAGNELLRSLKIAPRDPQPRDIAASPDADRIFLLEENGAMQRLRALTLLATSGGPGGPTSDWKVAFEKKIVPHQEFTIEDGTPIPAGGQPPPDKITVKLRPNTLEKNERAAVELTVGYDAGGSYLKTADGLPLQTISETIRLRRIVLAPSSEKAIDVFQDDGTVVEQFRLSGVDAMMAFDCGEIELK